MATVTPMRRNPVIATFYRRLRATKHSAKVAMTAARRKLLDPQRDPPPSPLMETGLTCNTVAQN
jgi:hypothetical protein